MAYQSINSKYSTDPNQFFLDNAARADPSSFAGNTRGANLDPTSIGSSSGLGALGPSNLADTGAALGSFGGPIGSAIGAGVGGIAGIIGSLVGGQKKPQKKYGKYQESSASELRDLSQQGLEKWGHGATAEANVAQNANTNANKYNKATGANLYDVSNQAIMPSGQPTTPGMFSMGGQPMGGSNDQFFSDMSPGFNGKLSSVHGLDPDSIEAINLLRMKTQLSPTNTVGLGYGGGMFGSGGNMGRYNGGYGGPLA